MADNYSSKNEIYPTLPPLPALPTCEPNTDNASRDPHNINQHLKLDFFNVLGEPDRSSYNFELLHTASNRVYQYSKLFIYRLLAVVIGLPLMLCWGIIFGFYSFAMIWFVAPARRLFQSMIAEAGIYTQTISDAVIAPVFRSFGYAYSNVRVSLTSQTVNTVPKPVQV